MSLKKLGWAWRRPLLAGAACLVAGACGARTGLDVPPPAPDAPQCVVDEDCDGFADLCRPVRCRIVDDAAAPERDGGVNRAEVIGVCEKLPPVDCDDNDPCTNEACEPGSGTCRYELASLDLDGDGYRGPRPGTRPGAPDSCGDDCNDASALAHPGGVEVCDGVDNDCNGIVDDGAQFIPVGGEVRVSGEVAPAGPGGLAFNGSSYAAVYTGETQGFDVYLSMLDPQGNKLPPGEQTVTLKNADGGGGPVVWIGDRFGLAWQDRRNADYEVYFTLLKPTGEKSLEDVRLSFADGFSINVALAYNGTEFIAVWQDQRSGFFDLYAQRVSYDGVPIDANVKLTDSALALENESPSIAVGDQTVGVAWTAGDAFSRVIRFRTFSPVLEQASMQVELTDGTTDTAYPTVVWNEDRYVVTWFDKANAPAGVYAATVDENGNVLTPAKPISVPPPNARSRYPHLRPLGDRVLFVYADDRDFNDGYELYTRMVDANLDPLGPEMRITNAARDSIWPIAAFGPTGDVGILFRDDRDNGDHDVYFTHLGCVTAGTP